VDFQTVKIVGKYFASVTSGQLRKDTGGHSAGEDCWWAATNRVERNRTRSK